VTIAASIVLYMQILDDRRYPATLLGVDNQPIATGEAQFYTSKGYGRFWPHTPVPEDLPPASAASVQTSEGRIVPIQNFRPCGSEWSGEHYEFDCLT
jgi:hypothetical protein